MPEGAVYVGRPTIFGNPYETAEQFREWMQFRRSFVDLNAKANHERRYELYRRLKELRGKDLACWCPLDRPCHADYLLELANSDLTKAS